MSGGLDAHLLCSPARIDQALDRAFLHQTDAPARHPLAVKGRPGLQGMKNVVADVDVLAEQPSSHATGEATALLLDRQAAKVHHEEAKKVEDRRRLQYHDVLAGLEITRLLALQRFSRSAVG